MSSITLLMPLRPSYYAQAPAGRVGPQCSTLVHLPPEVCNSVGEFERRLLFRSLWFPPNCPNCDSGLKSVSISPSSFYEQYYQSLPDRNFDRFGCFALYFLHLPSHFLRSQISDDERRGSLIIPGRPAAFPNHRDRAGNPPQEKCWPGLRPRGRGLPPRSGPRGRTARGPMGSPTSSPSSRTSLSPGAGVTPLFFPLGV